MPCAITPTSKATPRARTPPPGRAETKCGEHEAGENDQGDHGRAGRKEPIRLRQFDDLIDGGHVFLAARYAVCCTSNVPCSWPNAASRAIERGQSAEPQLAVSFREPQRHGQDRDGSADDEAGQPMRVFDRKPAFGSLQSIVNRCHGRVGQIGSAMPTRKLVTIAPNVSSTNKRRACRRPKSGASRRRPGSSGIESQIASLRFAVGRETRAVVSCLRPTANDLLHMHRFALRRSSPRSAPGRRDRGPATSGSLYSYGPRTTIGTCSKLPCRGGDGVRPLQRVARATDCGSAFGAEEQAVEEVRHEDQLRQAQDKWR